MNKNSIWGWTVLLVIIVLVYLAVYNYNANQQKTAGITTCVISCNAELNAPNGGVQAVQNCKNICNELK